MKGAKKMREGAWGRPTRSIDLSGLSRERERLVTCIFYHAMARPILLPLFNIYCWQILPSLPRTVLYYPPPIKHSKAWEPGRALAGVVDPLSFLSLSLLSLSSNLCALSVSITREEEEGVRGTQGAWKLLPSLERRSRCRDVVILPADDEAIMHFELRKVERRKENVCANSGSRDATSLSTLKSLLAFLKRTHCCRSLHKCMCTFF